MKKISLIIVDDHPLFRQGVADSLALEADMLVVGQAASGEEGLDLIRTLKPQIALMDINLPGISGIECILALKEQNFPAQFIMLTVFEDPDAIFQSLSAGATGYLIKQTPPAKLLEAIQDVYRGGSPMSGEIARKVVQSFQHPVPASGPDNGLTKREEEILSYLVKGYFYKEIAGQLFISTETVRTHIRNIYEKLQVRTRSEAILKYLRK